MSESNLLWLNQVSLKDLPLVGGKNASLGEMYVHLSKQGIRVPNGFVVTTEAYRQFLVYNQLDDQIPALMKKIEPDNLVSLSRTGLEIRTRIQNGQFPPETQTAIIDYYQELSSQYLDMDSQPQTRTDVAVRSSATLEDLPNASFAGQQETYLNVRGSSQICQAIKNCFASLYTDRAISYRHSMHFEDVPALISVCVQKMVRSDLASAGVAFTLDPESGFREVIVINSAWGLGEMVVQGSVNPDELIVFKPTLRQNYPAIIDRKVSPQVTKMVYGTNPDEKVKVVPVCKEQQSRSSISNEQALELARWAVIIEDYYTEYCQEPTPMDIEWAIDGLSGLLFIVQARPETVASIQIKSNQLVRYQLDWSQFSEKESPIITGIAVGQNVASGSVKVIHTLDSRDGSLGVEGFEKGDILVTEYTSPDWGPILEKAGAVITTRGSRTSHAAIVARELGIPAVVGTGNATTQLQTGQIVTVSCCEGEQGFVYADQIPFTKQVTQLDSLPTIQTQLKVNLGNPDLAFRAGQLPNHAGVGLARLEFIISESVKWHPLCLLDYDAERLVNSAQRAQVAQALNQAGYASGREYYLHKLAFGMAKIGAAFYPQEVLVRFSDFKSNEYSSLKGSDFRDPPYEPVESNAMLGWRGASRYYDPEFKPAFQLECQAFRLVRETLGLTNVHPMIPFVRSVTELKEVLQTMSSFGLRRGIHGLKVCLMIELPCNFLLAKEFSDWVDSFSIGSNDITQLTLGVDRDNERVAHLYDERDPAVLKMIQLGLQAAKTTQTPVGCCGQGPADHPDFAEFLVRNGISSVSVVPDAYLQTLMNLDQVERDVAVRITGATGMKGPTGMKGSTGPRIWEYVRYENETGDKEVDEIEY